MDTIYAFWDAAQIKYVLDSVAILTSMSDYLGLMKVFAIFGLFVAVATTFVKARGEDAAIYILMLAVWYVGLFLPKKDVVVQDIAGGGTYTVANVPLGLAVFASAESHIGYWLTRVSETVFALPADINFQSTGFMFGSRAIKDRMSVRFYDPNLVSSLTNLTKDCVYPELNNNAAFFDQIMKSGNIWADIAPQMNPGLLVQVYDSTAGTYKVTGCDQAWAYIDAQINPHVANDILPRLGQMLNPGAPTAGAASALVAAQLPAADNFIFGVSQSAQDSIKQAAMINLLADSTVYVPQIIGDTTSAQVALSTAMASASANSSYRTMAKIAESSMPLIRNAIHIVILSLFPIVMLLIVVAGSKGGLVFKTYLMALLWINLWAPVYAALNFFTSWYSTLGAKAAVGSMNYLSYASHQALTHSMISDQGVAGILTLSVPVIAYMLTNVSAASFTSVISGIMSPANSSAQSAGSQVGLGNSAVGNTQWGNVTMGNWSWNNRSGDQWNTAPTLRHGAATDTQVLPGGATVTSVGGAAGVLNMGATVPDLGVLSANASSLLQNSFQTKSAEAYSNAATHASIRQDSLNAAYDQIKAFSQGNRGSTRVGSDSQIATMAQFMQASDQARQTAAKWDAGIKLSDSQKFQIVSEASMGARIPGTAIGAQLKGMGLADSQIQALYESALAYSESSGFKTQTQQMQNLGNTITTNTGSEAYRQATRDIRATLGRAKSASESEQIALNQARSFEEASTIAASRGGGASINMSRFIQDDLGGAHEANAILSGMTDAQKLAYGQGMADNFVARLAYQTHYGDPDSNAAIRELAQTNTPTLGQMPSEMAAQATQEVREQHTGDQKTVPGNAGAAPAVSMEGQTITPKTVKAAERAGQHAADVQLDDGHGAADSGRKEVTAPVQEQTENPNLFTRSGRNAFAGGKPQDGNPAAKPKNTGDASGEW